MDHDDGTAGPLENSNHLLYLNRKPPLHDFSQHARRPPKQAYAAAMSSSLFVLIFSATFILLISFSLPMHGVEQRPVSKL